MALRLTGPAQPAAKPAAPTSPAAPTPASHEVLVRRGAAAVAAEDLSTWRELWSEVDALADPWERVRAQQGLAASVLQARKATVVVLARRYAALADAVVTALEADPRDPQLLNFAGLAFYELGAIAVAEVLFGAAQRLDPALPHVGANLAECARRRRSGTAQVRGLPPVVMAAVRDLTPRARRAAAAAQPVTGLTLSLCMIVKDEEAMLGQCLASVAGAVDEIVVVDTGSTDRTVAIAESFGAKVLHHTWTGDFAAARNVSFDAASSDWILYLDADEVLVEGDGERLRALTGKVWHEAFFLVETNHTGELDHGTAMTHDALRVFRNRPEYRFQGRIHEQIMDRLPRRLPERICRTDVRLEHFGYLGAVRDAKGKSQRNLELLERQVAEGDDTPFIHYNLGSEYLAAQDFDRSVAELRKGWDGVREQGMLTVGFAPSLIGRLVQALRALGRHDAVDAAAAEGLEIYPGYTDLLYEQARDTVARGDLDGAEALLRRCLEWGDAPSVYSAAVGSGTHLASLTLAEVLRLRGDLAGAEAELRATLADRPNHPAALEALAAVLLRAGADPAGVLDAVRAAGPGELAPSVRFLVAVVLYEAGAVQEAETVLRDVLAAQPGAAPARVALAEALLSQDRLAEAADVAVAVDAGAGVKGAALRTELFCRLAEGDGSSPEVAEALGAARDRMPVAEVAALRAWAGAAAAGTVPSAAAEPVALMLDVLARLERFDAFEALAGVLAGSQLPLRDRREVLAQVYVSRGFLDSAAEEWLTAVEESGADGRALRGLAVVADGRGLHEDAALLREEADALGV